MADRDEGTGLELSPDAMRAMGYAVVDRLVERITGLGGRPAWGGATREEMRERLAGLVDGPAALDTADDPAEAFGELLDALAERVLPYRGSVDHPRFFAFVPS